MKKWIDFPRRRHITTTLGDANGKARPAPPASNDQRPRPHAIPPEPPPIHPTHPSTQPKFLKPPPSTPHPPSPNEKIPHSPPPSFPTSHRDASNLHSASGSRRIQLLTYLHTHSTLKCTSRPCSRTGGRLLSGESGLAVCDGELENVNFLRAGMGGGRRKRVRFCVG